MLLIVLDGMQLGRVPRTAGGRSQRGYVEPVQAPPCPYHILAQQLMALVLPERGVGKSQWFSWINTVPGFAKIPPERVAELVDAMLAKGILWSDDGILAFAPEGEATFGRQNSIAILSVFTSPPLFTVMSGQKELGKVHESTFYRREEGLVILVLAGRNWKTRHLDWKRRVAHVEPTDEKGRSRWLGEGQMLSHGRLPEHPSYPRHGSFPNAFRRVSPPRSSRRGWMIQRESARLFENADEWLCRTASTSGEGKRAMDFYTYTTTREACSKAGLDRRPDDFYETRLRRSPCHHSRPSSSSS